MAKLVKCRNCEYQVARTANNCVQCHTKNPGLTTTDHFINTLCFAALLLGLMLKVVGLANGRVNELNCINLPIQWPWTWNFFPNGPLQIM